MNDEVPALVLLPTRSDWGPKDETGLDWPSVDDGAAVAPRRHTHGRRVQGLQRLPFAEKPERVLDHSQTADRKFPYCKACACERTKRWRAEHPTRYKLQNAADAMRRKFRSVGLVPTFWLVVSGYLVVVLAGDISLMSSKARATGVAEAKHAIGFAATGALSALSALQNAQDAQQKARLELIDAERNLKDHRNSIIGKYADDPKAMGSNEAAREAFLSAQCAQSITLLDNAKRAAIVADGVVIHCRLTVDQAEVSIDHAKGLIELAKVRSEVTMVNAGADALRI